MLSQPLEFEGSPAAFQLFVAQLLMPDKCIEWLIKNNLFYDKMAFKLNQIDIDRKSIKIASTGDALRYTIKKTRQTDRWNSEKSTKKYK